MTSALWLMLTTPGVEEQLRADRSLIPRFVDECLRLESPTQGMFRHTTRDVELHGVTIPAGATGGIGANETRDSVGAPQNANRQTDLVLFNEGANPAVVTVTGFDGDANVIGSTDVPVAAGQAVRLVAVLSTLGADSVDSARVRVALASGTPGTVTALIEQIELNTGDVDVAPLR